MIKGIGCDLCEVRRMEENLQNERFLARFFTEGERAYINARGVMRAQTTAGMFAAKEAFVKALGTGFGALSVQDVEISHDESGAPFYVMSEKLRHALLARGAKTAFLSISHDGGFAMATAVLEGE